jgi:hypothetical protein
MTTPCHTPMRVAVHVLPPGDVYVMFFSFSAPHFATDGAFDALHSSLINYLPQSTISISR